MTNIKKYIFAASAIATALVVFFPGYGILAKTGGNLTSGQLGADNVSADSGQAGLEDSGASLPSDPVVAAADVLPEDLISPELESLSPHSEDELRNLDNIKDCAGCHVDTGPGSGLATGQPGINNYPGTPPGQSTKLARPYPGAPPFVPHSISGLKVTRDRNDCVSCHGSGVEMSPGHVATRIPSSHFDGNELEVAGRRYNCLQCHVIQSGEEPPVS